MLLDANCGVQVPNAKGATALHKAAIHGHVSVVEALVARGAKVVIGDGAGNTALVCAHIGGAAGVARCGLCQLLEV